MGKTRGGKSRLQGSGGSGLTGVANALADALAGVTDPATALKKSLEATVTGLASFGKGLVEGSAEVKRAEAAFSELKSTLAAPALQGLASSIAPGLGGAVDVGRKVLGGITAAGAATSELQGYAERAAFAGMPLDKEFEKSVLPLLEARQRSVEFARQQAADVAAPHIKEEAMGLGKAYLDAASLGWDYVSGQIGDVFKGMFNGGSARVP